MNIKDRRKALGWRREDLAAASGVSMATIYRIESGKTEGSTLAVRALVCAIEDEECKRNAVGGNA